ncbi:hypothetical protein [Streptomyces sp. B3I8]|uniref:hypothetical protein n=1 Tax=Streptomyces sp. B3I8 TaxID=3042303 RepID=UPI00277FAA86|nr:hypothetical protein [Streptomyces sp. B3I8]MDQ0790370.1 hypothetical protein [Streptomyces sp. B3I8]
MIGDLSEIPEFSGDLDQLEKDAGSLKKAASDIRGTGADVHKDFQGLTSCYTAPEADQLFATTLPVRDKADAFATKLETVSGALSTFAKDARPLVQQMDQLRNEAAAFRKSVEGDDDWRQDQDSIDKNAHLVHEIGRIWGQFQELERSTATKIDGQVGGTRWIADDGTHKKGMYGFDADDAAKADDTPWGTVDEREYTGLAAAWHWTKDNVGGALKGFFVDGVWGTLKGLGHMVNVFDWDTFTKTWKGIGDVFGGVSAYLMTPYDWAMDKMFGPADHSDTDRQKKALRDFGKSLIAYDEWGTNPARAGGTVAFNVLTLGAGSFLKLGKAGSLGAKAGEMGEAGKAATAASRTARIANALGKGGRLADPMTYIAKGAGLAKLKAGDMMAGLRDLHSGAADDFLHHADSPTHTPAGVTDNSVRYPDGSILHQDGTMLTPEGKPHQNPIPVESSATERLARDGNSSPHLSSPSHTPVHADQPVPAHVGGGNAAEAAAHARGPGSPSAPSHGAAHSGGDAGHGTPAASHQPGHTGHGGTGTATAPTTHGGPNGGGHEIGGHDTAAHGGDHDPAGNSDGYNTRHSGYVPADAAGSVDQFPGQRRDSPHPEGKGWYEDLEPHQIKDVQVYRANHDPGYFEKYYRDNGRRHRVFITDESGYPPPHLKKDPNHPGNWIAAADKPSPFPEKYVPNSRVEEGSDTVPSDNGFDAIRDAAHRRHASVQTDNSWHDPVKTAKDTYVADPTPENLRAYQEVKAEHAPFHEKMSADSEDFGEAVARHHVVPEHYKGYQQEELTGPKNGNDQFDQVWSRTHEDGSQSFLVIEAKGSHKLDLGKRELPTGFDARQGSHEYFNDILRKMRERGIAGNANEMRLYREIRKSLKQGNVEYVLIKAKSTAAGEYAGYVKWTFDIK